MTDIPDVDPTTIRTGLELSSTRIEVPHATVVMGATATGAFFGGHIDPAYARDVQGRRDIYLATGHIVGYLDRHVLTWAGPRAFLSRRGTNMRSSICAGDTITITSTVIDVRTGQPGAVSSAVTEVDLDTVIVNQMGERCVTAAVTVQIPEDRR